MRFEVELMVRKIESGVGRDVVDGDGSFLLTELAAMLQLRRIPWRSIGD